MSMSKAKVLDLLARVRANTRVAADVDLRQAGAFRLLGGQGMWFLLTASDGQTWQGSANDESEAGPCLVLVGDGALAFDEAVEELGKDAVIGAQVSRKAIVSELDELVRLCHREPATELTEPAHVRPMLKRLRARVEQWSVVMPVDNLKLLLDEPLELAGVRLVRGADAIEATAARLHLGVDRTLGSSEAKATQKVQLQELLEKQFPVDAAWLWLDIAGEEGRVAELARARAQRAVDVLRCLGRVRFPSGERRYIGLRGDVHRDSQLSVRFAGSGMGVDLQATGALFPCELDEEALTHFRDACGLDALSRLLAKETSAQGELEEAISAAVSWIGRGLVEPDPASRALFLTIGLERLLLGDGEPHDNIADRIARRLSWLLGETKDVRLRLSRTSKELYNLRSEVAHTGCAEIDDDKVSQLEILTVHAIIRMALRTAEWSTHGAFAAWVEEQLLA